MNLLLFLSAILSALTGVISGGRVADVQVERSYGGLADAGHGVALTVAPVEAVRPWLALAGGRSVAASAVAPIALAAAPVSAAPIYLNKRRE